MGGPVIRQRRAGRNHWYVNEKDERVPQVSGIAKSGVDKSNQMIAWASRVTADYVLDHWDELEAMSLSERYWTVRGVAQKIRNTAATKGTKLHAVLDKLAAGQPVEYDPEMEEDVQAGLAFLRDFDASPVLSEATIWSERFNYAGRFDTIQELATGPMQVHQVASASGVFWENRPTYETWLLDYKRAGGVYPENAIQGIGYASADWVMDDDGQAHAMPEIDHIGIVHINAELPGGYALIPVPDDRREELLGYFRHAQHMAHFAEIGHEFLGDPVEPPTWDDDEEETLA